MTLREHLRKEWGMYIRPLMLKEECEWCGCKEDLHLHHIDRFHNLLMETLEELQLQELNLEDYLEFELKQISHFMLAKQLKSKYKTLCRQCHMKLHAIEKNTDEYKNHYYNPNGGYIQLSQELFELEGLTPHIITKFIKLCCNTTYDGVVKDKRNKAVIKDGLSKFLMKKLNLKKTETHRFIVKSKELNLFEFKNNMIHINKKYAQKGFINFKGVVKVFDKTFNELYDNVEPTKHKIIGRIILANVDNVNEFNSKYFEENITRASRSLSMLNLGKMKNRTIYYNPNIIYKGSLDYSYKNAIDKYNEVN